MDIYCRTRALLGDAVMERLKHSRVAVFGIGGVGAYCAEGLARCGVGQLELIDPDTVSESNINRQLIALRSTVGRSKAAVMAERIADIDPETGVRIHEVFYDEHTRSRFELSEYDFIADCIDTVTSKLLLIREAKEAGVPIISCLGTGNRLHPERFRVADIYETSGCPLARIMRRLCRENGIERLRVVFSDEPAAPITVEEENGRHPPASVSFVPPAAGMVMCGEIVRSLIGQG